MKNGTVAKLINMKNAILILLMTVLASCAQHEGKKTIVKNGDSYECVLLDKYEKLLSCGVRAVASGMRFELSSDGTEIAVVIRCPDGFDDGFFSKGDKYRITLTTDSAVCKGYDVYNKYKDSLPTYYALDVVKK